MALRREETPMGTLHVGYKLSSNALGTNSEAHNRGKLVQENLQWALKPESVQAREQGRVCLDG
jgi:hypothetical protein